MTTTNMNEVIEKTWKALQSSADLGEIQIAVEALLEHIGISDLFNEESCSFIAQAMMDAEDEIKSNTDGCEDVGLALLGLCSKTEIPELLIYADEISLELLESIF